MPDQPAPENKTPTMADVETWLADVEDLSTRDLFTDAPECQGQIQRLHVAVHELARTIRALPK